VGDVGGAVCDLRGGVIGSGKSIGSVGSGDASRRDVADWGESVFEWANPSTVLRDPDRWGSYAANQ
jgi:hypothetical protein